MGVMTSAATATTSAPVFLPRGRQRFIIGLDLGQAGDYTAISVCENRIGVMDAGTELERHCGLSTDKQTKAEFIDVRFLERLPLGTSYPAIVEYTKQLLGRPPLCGDAKTSAAELIVDASGCGRPVADLFDDAGLRPAKVIITAGFEVTYAGSNYWHVSKSHLISSLDAALHSGKLRIAATLLQANALAEELKDFRRKVSDAGRQSYSARASAHDDLVLSISLASWWVSRRPSPSGFGFY